MRESAGDQDHILRACQHVERYRSEVKMGNGEILMVCCECWNAGVAARKAARKTQLDAMPRCEVSGCRRRQTWILGNVGMCGRHRTNAQREFSRQFGSFGILAMTVSLSKSDLLELAVKSSKAALAGGREE